MAEHLLDELSPVSPDLTPDLPAAPEDDLSRGYQARREQSDEDAVIERAMRAKAIAVNEPLEPALEPREKGEGGTLTDLARGVIEVPRAGVNALVEAGKELTENLLAITKVPAEFLEENLPLGRLPITEEDILSGFEAARLEDPESTTGKMTQGVLQFLVGFLPAMKVTKGLQAVKGGRVVQPMVAGSLADVAVIDEQMARLADLIETFPALQNPATEFLATDPDDTVAEGKLKQAIEGLILGGVADGLVESLRWMRKARVARQEAEDVTGQAAVRQAEVLAQAETSPEQLRAAIGDETAPVFRVTEETDAAAAALLERTPRAPIKLDDGLEIQITPSEVPLTPRQASVEQRFTAAIETDPEGMIRRYEDLPDTAGGRILNTDEARLLSDDYAASPETKSALSPAVHEPASALIKVMYTRRLAQAPKADELARVRFTMGGAGAGKSVAIKRIDAVETAGEGAIKPQIIFDTNMNNFGSANAKIQQALAAGKDVSILYVLRDPVDSLVNGTLKRAMNPESGGGRTVQLATHLETHVGAINVAKKLLKKYAGDDRFSLQVIDNRKGIDQVSVVDASVLDEIDYSGMAPRLREALDQEFANGNISETVYRGTLGDTPPGAGVPGGAGGLDEAAQVAAQRAEEAGLLETGGGPGRPAVRGEPEAGGAGRGGPGVTPPRPEGIPDTIPDRIGNINLARIGGPEDVRQVIADAARLFEPKLTTPLQTNRQTALLANEIAVDPRRLTEVLTREGAFTAAEVTAIRFMLHSSGRQLKDMAVKVASAGASDLDKFVFRRQMAFHAALLEQASGAARESGRALQAFKITALGAAEQDRAVRELVQSADQGLSTSRMAAMLATLDEPQQIATFVRQSQRAKTSDVLLEAWINGLLSGPQTHAVNTLSNTVVAFWQIPERALAAQIRKLSGGEGVVVGEATAQAFGLIKGVPEALRLAGMALRTGEPSDVFTKIEARRFRSISAEGFGLDEGSAIARGVDLLGEVVRTPGRALATEDEFFKAVGYRMELQARAYRQAAQEGLDGDRFASRVQEIINNPPADLRLALIDVARYQTFTKPLGAGGRSFTTAINKAPALRLIMPFIRTPLNIMKFVGERTPLAWMSKAVRMEIAAGGARQDLALAKLGLGSMMMAAFADMSASGQISGSGPSDRRLRGALRRTGWQPYSIKVGDGWVAYNRLDPIGATLGIAADLSNILGQAEQADVDAVVSAAVMAVSQNIVSKTYMSGIADVMEVFASVSPEAGASAAQRWIQRMAGTLVPAGSAQVTRVIDPNMRQVRTMVEKIRSRIPGLSDTLPPRLNMWGEPIMYTGGVGPDIASPLWYSPVRKDHTVDIEMARLEMGVSMPSRMLRGVEMEPETYNAFVRLAGSDLKDPGTGLGAQDTLKAIISGKHVLSSEYEEATDGPDGGKALVIREIVQSFRQAARASILDPDSPHYQQDFAEELGEVRRQEALQLGVSLSP